MLRRILGALAALAMAVALPAWAQDWPTRPVTITVCFPPGASTDAVARRIGERLSTSLGRPVVVENRGGAGGNIAAAQIARAAPDGHSLLFCATSGLVIAAASRAPLDFDPQRDLVPVASVGDLVVLLMVRSTLPAQTLEEFVAYARTHPGQVNFASIGVGSSFHLGIEQINAIAGVATTHVPFRGGGQAVPELLAGRIDAMFASWSLARPHVQSGGARPLAVTGSQRYAAIPEVPTMAEAGMPQFWLQEALGVFAPAGTPPPVVARLNTEVGRIVSEPGMRDWMDGQGVPPTPASPEAFRAQLQQGVTTIEALIRRTGLQLN